MCRVHRQRASTCNATSLGRDGRVPRQVPHPLWHRSDQQRTQTRHGPRSPPGSRQSQRLSRDFIKSRRLERPPSRPRARAQNGQIASKSGILHAISPPPFYHQLGSEPLPSVPQSIPAVFQKPPLPLLKLGKLVLASVSIQRKPPVQKN